MEQKSYSFSLYHSFTLPYETSIDWKIHAYPRTKCTIPRGRVLSFLPPFIINHTREQKKNTNTNHMFHDSRTLYTQFISPIFVPSFQTLSHSFHFNNLFILPGMYRSNFILIPFFDRFNFNFNLNSNSMISKELQQIRQKCCD